jgi:hypothetical protein
MYRLDAELTRYQSLMDFACGVGNTGPLDERTGQMEV